ncbi:MAG: thioesterase family protein [Acidimicrobiales bacterium]
MTEFDEATAIEPAGEGTWSFHVDAGFTVGPKPNGGYLLAVAARAAGAAAEAQGAPHLDPLAATAHFPAAPDVGPAVVATRVLRTGRSASQVHTTIEQDGRPCVDATFTLGTLADGDAAADWSATPPIELPPIDACIRLPAHREGAPFVVSIMDRTDLRLDPSCLGFATGARRGEGELRGWVAFADGREVDPLGLLYFLDCFPPATFDIAPSGWVPTLSLTAYVRARPAPGPLRTRMAAGVVREGKVDEVCEIWDAEGRLVAQATQLAAVRFDEAPAPYPGAG